MSPYVEAAAAVITLDGWLRGIAAAVGLLVLFGVRVHPFVGAMLLGLLVLRGILRAYRGA